MAPSPDDPLVAKLLDRREKSEAIARAIAQLTPDEAAFFLHKLEHAYRKRKLQLSGYLVALVAWLVGMTLALIYFRLNDMSSIWAFLVPFGIVGVILYGFGAWAERVGRTPPPGASARPVADDAAGQTTASSAGSSSAP